MAETPIAADIQLDRGTLVVLAGPQGCGKSRLAQRIADSRGRYATVDAPDLVNKPVMNSILRGKPQTLIVDGDPSWEGFEVLKALLTSDATVTTRWWFLSSAVRTPDILLTTCNEPLYRGMRRARVFPIKHTA